MVIWVTGLSGSGKTTLCNALYKMIKPHIPESVLLDGDVIRKVFGNDLGYSEKDRIRQVKRLQTIAKLLSDQNMVVIVAVLYAHPELLYWNRHNIKDYFEVYLKVSIETVKKRDNKGLYSKSAGDKVANIVGIDIPWHTPNSPDLLINNDSPEPPEILADRVVALVPRLTSTIVDD